MSTPIDIKEAVENMFLSLPGVTGIGIGKNSPESINMYLKSACPKITCNIPKEIGGVPVKQIVTGKITSLAQMAPLQVIDRTARERPYFGGVSIGHPKVSAGTLGVKCFDATTRETLILSNNHILAAETSIQNKRAEIGDAILQPGSYDKGVFPEDRIGTLVRNIDFDEVEGNLIDGAVARPDNPDELQDIILEIGKVTEIADSVIGDIVMISGRTSGLNSSIVVDTNATIKVDYENIKGMPLKNQIIMIPALGAGGDSGAVVVRKKDKNAVGLLSAGSSTISVANRMTYVAQELSIDLGSPAPLPSPDQDGEFWGNVTALGLLAATTGIPLAVIIKHKKNGKNGRYNGR